MAGSGPKYVGLRIDGDALKRLLNGPDGPVAKTILRTIVKGERYAKLRCPVDTGRLRSSITHRLDYSGSGFAGDAQFVGVVGTDVEYAPYVELGARGRAPVGFLRGGVEQAVKEMNDKAVGL